MLRQSLRVLSLAGRARTAQAATRTATKTRFASTGPQLRPAAAVSAAPLISGLSAAAVAGLVGYVAMDEAHCGILDWFPTKPQAPALDSTWTAVQNDVQAVIEADAYLGATFVRLAWHCSGTYDAASNTGGSNGAYMRFKPESDHGANAGLGIARDALEPVKAKYPDITYADLYTFVGKVAVEVAGGPVIPWTPGRTDATSNEGGTPDGRLPDADKGGAHVRTIFGRMGFTDREAVALIGAHTLGRCYTTRSGYEGPWAFDEFGFDNSYYQLLVDEQWETNMDRKPLQYRDSKTKTLMMLPSDMALVEDNGLRQYTELYAKDSDLFFKDFAAAFGKLLENGVPRN